MKKKTKITILSTCTDPWGGSEELYSKSIPYLLDDGYSIDVLKKNILNSHKRIAELKELNIKLIHLEPFEDRRIINLLLKGLNSLKYPNRELSVSRFKFYLKKNKPRFVILSQGNNFDGMHYARACADIKIPYAILSHKAIDYFWPHPDVRSWMSKTFKQAKKCFFVSPQNQRLTEEQFGFRFNNAEIVANPTKIKPEVLPYPHSSDGYRLACIGRLFVSEKGQDILFRILSLKKWRDRNLNISLVGSGRDHDGLKEMANLLNLKNVTFLGFRHDIKDILKTHHALVLPSRNEGMPLVVIEAMAAGRMVITTRAGGSVNLLEEGKTGFIGNATLQSFDEALERAWIQRENWQKMGVAANQFILSNIPQKPEIEFVNSVISLIDE